MRQIKTYKDELSLNGQFDQNGRQRTEQKTRGLKVGTFQKPLRSFVFGFTAALALAACSPQNHDYARGVPPKAEDGYGVEADVHADRLIDTAERLLAEGQIDAAIPIFRSLMSTSPIRARLGLAKAMIAHGRAEGAYDLTSVCEVACSDELGLVRGEAALSLGLYEEARLAYHRAMEIKPSARGLAGLGISQALTGNYQDAIQSFDKLPAPTGPSNKALVLIALDRAEEGKRLLEDLVRRGLAGFKERQNLALAYVLLGEHEAARTFVQLDLDLANAQKTLSFYRQLVALAPKERMIALVSGSIDPAWTRRDSGNLVALDQQEADAGAERLLAIRDRAAEKRVKLAAVQPVATPAPEPPPATAPIVEREVIPADAPPLLEAEGWAVQIAAYRKIAELMRGWELLKTANEDILATIPPRRSEIEFDDSAEGGPKGFYYRLNAGPLETLAEARDLCKALILRGTACWVRPPEASEGKLPARALAVNNSKTKDTD